MTLAEKTQRLFSETAAWLTTNSVNLLLAAFAGTAIALFMLAIRAFGHRLVADGSADLHWRGIVGRVLAKTSLVFIILTATELVAEHAETPPALLRLINILFVIAASFQAAIWARAFILGLIQQRVGDEANHRTLGTAMGLIRVLVTFALFAIAIILILSNLGVNVTGLVAGLGIGGIAIGLAAQGIFSDLFAALAIIFDRPFRKGDTITFNGATGTVDHIGLKSTRIRALGGEEIVISNAKLLDTQIQNWAKLERRRVVMSFGLVYQTPPAILAAIPAELRRITEATALATFDRAHSFQFGASSIDFEFVFFVESADYSGYMQARQDIMLAMMRRFEELGVGFAYPTQTSFTAAPDGSLVMPYRT